ncbi:hypothetical protein [Streptomyces sp. G-G2]|uniref:hypothetical protein n=1 Tax=Streptomyces sp. G-G2 TaxID=3046201 RepID=UPI0024BB3EA6|nr:hypothetical protein [Streptomyces sp. G-G2]MDJ0380155.1 hypothetical protein [Streptomyces sp. G-G2]
MSRRSRTGPLSPIFAFGAVLTAAGAALYLLPGPDMPLLAAGALALASVAAVLVSARQH